ncbi:hypothetical protein [Streptomyces sp. NPDC058664]|uniref:hypothetical protein n=1 Tax=unclassified Streptomyces TaxID=2593676 RepID=UPI003661C332
MKRVLDYIEQKKMEFAQVPFFGYMQDESIDPKRKLGFAEALAPWVMAFADINKYVLRVEGSSDPIQRIINTHTEEDDHHFVMFIEDLKTLGFDSSSTFAESLEKLWGPQNIRARKLTYGLTCLIASVDPVLRLAVIEVIEATGNVAFSEWRKIAQEFQAQTGQVLHYFGDVHLGLESGHAMGTEDIEESLSSIELTADQVEQAYVLVDESFRLFTDMIDELLAAVKA